MASIFVVKEWGQEHRDASFQERCFPCGCEFKSTYPTYRSVLLRPLISLISNVIAVIARHHFLDSREKVRVIGVPLHLWIKSVLQRFSTVAQVILQFFPSSGPRVAQWRSWEKYVGEMVLFADDVIQLCLMDCLDLMVSCSGDQK